MLAFICPNCRRPLQGSPRQGSAVAPMCPDCVIESLMTPAGVHRDAETVVVETVTVYAFGFCLLVLVLVTAWLKGAF